MSLYNNSLKLVKVRLLLYKSSNQYVGITCAKQLLYPLLQDLQKTISKHVLLCCYKSCKRLFENYVTRLLRELWNTFWKLCPRAATRVLEYYVYLKIRSFGFNHFKTFSCVLFYFFILKRVKNLTVTLNWMTFILKDYYEYIWNIYFLLKFHKIPWWFEKMIDNQNTLTSVRILVLTVKINLSPFIGK